MSINNPNGYKIVQHTERPDRKRLVLAECGNYFWGADPEDPDRPLTYRVDNWEEYVDLGEVPQVGEIWAYNGGAMPFLVIDVDTEKRLFRMVSQDLLKGTARPTYNETNEKVTVYTRRLPEKRMVKQS